MKQPAKKNREMAKGMKKTETGYDFSDEIKEAQNAFFKEFKEELNLQAVALTSVDGKPTIKVLIKDKNKKHLVPEKYNGFPTSTEVTGTIRPLA